MLQSPSIRKQVEIYTSKGNDYLSKAVEYGNQEAYLKAIQEYVSSYKFALLLNSKDGMEQMCAFNLGAAHIAGGDVMRGISMLQTILEHASHSQTNQYSQNSDSKKGDIYYNIAIGHEKLNDIDNAVKCYQHALLEYRDEERNLQRISETHLKLANIFNTRNELSDAQKHFSKAANAYDKMSNNKNEILALVCQANAAVSDTTVRRDECVRLLDVCWEKSKNLKHTNLQGKILCEIGLLYSTLGRLNHALICFEKSVRMCNKNTNLRRQAIALQNAGAILNRMGYYKESLLRHSESARIHGLLGNRNAQGQSFCNLGFAQIQLQNYEESWEAQIHALQAFKDTDDKQGQWQCHESLGTISFNNAKLDKAVQHFKLALSFHDYNKDNASRDRIVSKLANVLEIKANSRMIPDLQLAIENSPQNSQSSQMRRSIEIEPTVYEPDRNTNQNTSNKRQKRTSHLERGKRMYSDERNQPVTLIMKGISNLTQASNPLTDRYDTHGHSSDSEQYSSDFDVFKMKDFKFLKSSDDESDSTEDDEKQRVLGKDDKIVTRKKQLRDLVQASTMPINSLTTSQDHKADHIKTKTPRKSRKHVNLEEIVEKDNQAESVESTPRTDRSSDENLADFYKDQLSKIDEEELTDVTPQDSSSSSSSSSENERDKDKSVTPKKPPVKTPRKTPDRLRVLYVNDEDALYTKSMKHMSEKNEDQPGFKSAESTHIYESIRIDNVPPSNHASTSALSPDDETPPKYQDNDAVSEGNKQKESDSSGDEAPPLSSLYAVNNNDNDDVIVELEPNQESSGEIAEIQNRPLPSVKSDKRKKKNSQSRACLIM